MTYIGFLILLAMFILCILATIYLKKFFQEIITNNAKRGGNPYNPIYIFFIALSIALLSLILLI